MDPDSCFWKLLLHKFLWEKHTFIVAWNFARKKKIPEFTLIWSDHHKKEIYNSSSVSAKILPVFPKINFGKSNGAGLVTLLCFVMWMDLHIRIPKLEMFRKRTNFNCPNFDILCFRKCVNILSYWRIRSKICKYFVLIEEYVRKYENISYLLKNKCIFVVLLFLL